MRTLDNFLRRRFRFNFFRRLNDNGVYCGFIHSGGGLFLYTEVVFHWGTMRMMFPFLTPPRTRERTTPLEHLPNVRRREQMGFEILFEVRETEEEKLHHVDERLLGGPPQQL